MRTVYNTTKGHHIALFLTEFKNSQFIEDKNQSTVNALCM